MSEVLALSQPPAILTLLGHRLRWQLLTVLAQSDRRAYELVRLLKQPQNLVSYHLQQLRRYGLVQAQRSRADGREIYYSLDLERAKQLFFDAGESLHPALGETSPQFAHEVSTGRKPQVLFLCTHNSARSQMAEGLLRSRGGERIEVFSAGTEPSAVHPLAIRALQEQDIDISQHRSKSLQEFPEQDFDYIITVCDRAREACPVFPGDPKQIHWSFPDPVEVEGSEMERLAAFREIAVQLNTRIAYLLLAIERKANEN